MKTTVIKVGWGEPGFNDEVQSTPSRSAIMSGRQIIPLK